MSGNFFKMDNDIFKCGLNAYEFMVYSYLVMKADRTKMTCYPTVSKIALDCGISKSQVHKVTASLEGKGFITIDDTLCDFGCAKQKVLKLLDELENGIGLIERKRQGLGRPNIIYVKLYT